VLDCFRGNRPCSRAEIRTGPDFSPLFEFGEERGYFGTTSAFYASHQVGGANGRQGGKGQVDMVGHDLQGNHIALRIFDGAEDSGPGCIRDLFGIEYSLSILGTPDEVVADQKLGMTCRFIGSIRLIHD